MIVCFQCTNYEQGKIVGDMCSALCSSDGLVQSYSCRAFHAGKETVFAALWTNSTHQQKIVVKSAATAELFEGLEWTVNPYPREKEFISVIQQKILTRYSSE